MRVVFRGRGYRKGDKQETSTQIINRALPDLLSVIRDGIKTVIWEGQERGEGRGEQRRKQRQESDPSREFWPSDNERLRQRLGMQEGKQAAGRAGRAEEELRREGAAHRPAKGEQREVLGPAGPTPLLPGLWTSSSTMLPTLAPEPRLPRPSHTSVTSVFLFAVPSAGLLCSQILIWLLLIIQIPA